MKIGIITFHFAKNYGAVLQCFALSEYLKKQGHEVKIIDYRPPYHTVRFASHKPPFSYALWRYKFKKGQHFPPAVRLCAFKDGFFEAVKSNKEHRDDAVLELFENFRTNNLDFTIRYRKYNELKLLPPEADAYIAGSDQLWNPDLLDLKYDKAYFLDFGKDNTKRIGYAVSMGRDPTAREAEELRRLCAKLDAVSLRETSAAANATGRDVHICPDPTLLLCAEDYAAAEAKTNESEPYIFVYGLQTSENTIKAIDLAKKKYGLKIINGSPLKIKYEGATEVYDYGPDRFLSYIKNAACVVTNSFHGTTLSIIYRKDFITVKHTSRPKRMVELLEKTGVSYRLFEDESFDFVRPIDYTAVEKRLKIQRNIAAEYLFMALAGVKGEDIICKCGRDTYNDKR